MNRFQGLYWVFFVLSNFVYGDADLSMCWVLSVSNVIFVENLLDDCFHS